MWLWWIVFIVGGYLLGSLPSAYLLVKAKKGLDIRKFGSGNVGSTNTARVAGGGVGVLVFFMDALKGAIPAALALWLLESQPIAVCSGLAAFLGHLYPVWLSFKGGKGVATSVGVIAVLAPEIAAAAFLLWLMVSLLSGYVSLGSSAAALSLIPSSLITHQPWLYTLLFTVFCAMVLLKHRGNFQKIANGTEGKSFRRSAR